MSKVIFCTFLIGASLFFVVGLILSFMDSAGFFDYWQYKDRLPALSYQQFKVLFEFEPDKYDLDNYGRAYNLVYDNGDKEKYRTSQEKLATTYQITITTYRGFRKAKKLIEQYKTRKEKYQTQRQVDEATARFLTAVTQNIETRRQEINKEVDKATKELLNGYKRGVQ